MKKLKPIKAIMASANFAPEDGDGTYIEITVHAPIDTEIFPGVVTITYEEAMTNNDKRDAMYYEKCLRDLREKYRWDTKIDLRDYIREILEHKYEPPGVDLSKPNYGMFE